MGVMKRYRPRGLARLQPGFEPGSIKEVWIIRKEDVQKIPYSPNLDAAAIELVDGASFSHYEFGRDTVHLKEVQKTSEKGTIYDISLVSKYHGRNTITDQEINRLGGGLFIIFTMDFLGRIKLLGRRESPMKLISVSIDSGKKTKNGQGSTWKFVGMGLEISPSIFVRSATGTSTGSVSGTPTNPNDPNTVVVSTGQGRYSYVNNEAIQGFYQDLLQRVIDLENTARGEGGNFI